MGEEIRFFYIMCSMNLIYYDQYSFNFIKNFRRRFMFINLFN